MDLDTLNWIDHLPNEVIKITDAINKIGRAIIVGGFIRDSLLGHESYDIDIEVYDQEDLSMVEKALAVFGPIYSVGKNFGVLIFRSQSYHFDVALARIDNKIGIGHKGFKTTPSPYEDFATIAIRRDFTINAMGYDTKRALFLDPFHGREDLVNKVLNVVDAERFSEDPLRVLRALGFIARFELTPSPTLIELSRELIHNKALLELPKERLFNEFEKWLIKSPKPSLGFSFLECISFDLLPNMFNSLSKDPKGKELTLKALDKAPKQLHLLWVILYLGLTKDQAVAELGSITGDKKLLRSLAQFHQAYHKLISIVAKDDDKKKLFRLKQLASDISLKDLAALVACFDPNISSWLSDLAKRHSIYETGVPALIKGEDLLALGLQPSKKFSVILKKAYHLQLKEGHLTKDQILEILALSKHH